MVIFILLPSLDFQIFKPLRMPMTPFLEEMDANLTTLLASTFLGGSNDEFRVSINLDDNQNIFVSTETYSNDIPITGNVFVGGFTHS